MEPPRIRTLPNGIQLIAVPRAAAPIAAVLLQVRVGSADEEPHEEGLAHVLEHLVVRCAMDGGRVGDGALVAARAGKESTSYSVVMRRADVAAAVAALGSAFRDLHVPPADLAAELAAIRAERAQRQDDPAWRLRESLFGVLWSGTRCAHPVLGDPDVVDNVTPDRIRRFHRAWYRTANAVLVIAADRPADLLPAIAATAAGWQDPVPAALTVAATPGARPDAGGARGRSLRALRAAERPGAACVAVASGPLSGVAVARRAGGSSAAVIACDAVAAATGLAVQAVPLRGWLCAWIVAAAPAAGAAGDPIAAALAEAHGRVTAPNGAAWLHAEVLIPRLRKEDDIETVPLRAADPRALIRAAALRACPAAAVADLLAGWRRQLRSVRPVPCPADGLTAAAREVRSAAGARR